MLCYFDGWYVNSFVFKIFAMRSHTMIQNYFMIILKCLVIFVFFFSQHVRISNRMDAHCFFSVQPFRYDLRWIYQSIQNLAASLICSKLCSNPMYTKTKLWNFECRLYFSFHNFASFFPQFPFSVSRFNCIYPSFAFSFPLAFGNI